MAEGDSPTAARRRVRLAIRAARDAAGLTQNQVADEMEWSLSKVVRIESGDVSISPNDLRALLEYLGIGDRTVVGSLLADARIARTRQSQAWYQKPEVREHTSDALRHAIEYEAQATTIRSYAVYYPPGPLQTSAYAAALTGARNGTATADRVRTLAEVRQLRHDHMLARLDSLQIFLLVDQAVLERTIGSRATLADQLRELRDLADRGLINIRMLPFDLDSPITDNGGFDLLSLGDDPTTDVMYRQTGVADELVENAPVTKRHRERFEQLWQVASDEVDTIDFISSRIEALQKKNPERQSHR
jgi:transcriptional regulator with XRE-family HTH domain